MLTFLNSRCQEKNARVLSMKKTLPFKTIKKNRFGGHAAWFIFNSEIPLRTTRRSSRTTTLRTTVVDHLTFLVLLLGHHSHGHGVRASLELKRAGQSANLQGSERTLQCDLIACVSPLAIFALLSPWRNPVIHLQPNGIHTMRHAGAPR